MRNTSWRIGCALAALVTVLGGKAHAQFSGPVPVPAVLGVALGGGMAAAVAGEAPPPPPVQLQCTASPARVFAGDPVKMTGEAQFLSPHRKPVWTWQSTGGNVSAAGNTATIDTSGLAAGEYSVTGQVSDGKRKHENATCEARFTVQPFQPPTLACTASPAMVVSGTDVQITAAGRSPQNRPLTYTYASTAGMLTPDKSVPSTAQLSTAGLGQTLIAVTCTVADDHGQTAHATAQVSVKPPEPPPLPQTQELCSLSFERDRQRPVRVDNEAKGCLDDIALTLNAHTDAKLVMIGSASPEEHSQAAAERTLNARQYLTEEKGINASRIELRVGEASSRGVRDVLVPSGASLNAAGTQGFDEAGIVRHGEAYGIPGQHRHAAHPGPPIPSPVPPAGQVPPPRSHPQ